MIFKNDGYDNYKYLVEVGSNYVCLTDRAHSNNDDINVLYQYINPSITTIESTRYMSGDNYYDNISSQFSDNFFDRGDAPIIFIVQFLICVWFVWLLNQLSKLFHKGGVFGG